LGEDTGRTEEIKISRGALHVYICKSSKFHLTLNYKPIIPYTFVSFHLSDPVFGMNSFFLDTSSITVPILGATTQKKLIYAHIRSPQSGREKKHEQQPMKLATQPSNLFSFFFKTNL